MMSAMTPNVPDGFDELTAIVAQFVGRPILWHISDDRYGSVLDIGDKLKRRTPLPNPHLTKDQQQYTGTHSLWVDGGCTLQVPQGLPRPPNDPNFGLFDVLVGREITDANVEAIGLCLSVVVDDGYMLEVDPGQSKRPFRPGYVAQAAKTWVTANPDGTIKVFRKP
jgi:hypothetical protein